MVSRFNSARHLRDILEGISAAEREVLVRTLVAGLRELPPMWSDSEAFRTIIIDLDPPLFLHGVFMAHTRHRDLSTKAVPIWIGRSNSPRPSFSSSENSPIAPVGQTWPQRLQVYSQYPIRLTMTGVQSPSTPPSNRAGWITLVGHTFMH